MDSNFMASLSGALADAGVRVWRFEFSYMQQRRQDGRRRPPPAVPRLLEEWRKRLADLPREEQEAGLFIGGKSLGARTASLIAAEEQLHGVNGCLCFGYPFHAPAKPDKWRTEHFPRLRIPTWIAQGERDPFGSRSRILERAELPADNPRLYWARDGNHDLMPRKSSGTTWEQNLAMTAAAAAAFMVEHRI